MKKTNVRKAFSRFFGLALLVSGFTMSFTSVNAQISPSEAVKTIELEKSNIQAYFQDKFPSYPDVRPANLSSVDWDQVNHVFALNRLSQGLQDSNVLSIDEEIREAAQMDYPDSATPNGLYFENKKHPKSADNPVYLESYLRNVLGL